MKTLYNNSNPNTNRTIPNYQISETIYDGSRTLVYRAIRNEDKLPVVIKLLKNDYPTFSELVQFRNQYTIAKNLKSPRIVQNYSLENYQNSYALVMEDFGAISLQEWALAGGNLLSLPEFLPIAIALCNALEVLYRDRIIHKDIKPSNILINPETKQVKLIDFSLASLLPRETQTLINPHVLEGTLAYISPEQTGRMNRGIDYRTDFYSLGVTFYELLAGELPFQSNDPMELVHSHIAKPVVPVHKNRAEIPLVLSEIISKLMAKNAEDRYQSVLGLKFDLEKCLEGLEETGEIQSFAIGQRDLCDRFMIPDKLYGRETEVATLLQAFERVSLGTSEMMLVAGFSGIGKTAVVSEVHKPIVRQHGYFIKGKFDQFQRNIPFSAFVQAFRDLMGQLLTESPDRIQQWQSKILAAVGENGQVIIEVIPELERIIGQQPLAIELSGTAAQNRFNLLFQKFTQVFTSAEHPLVIFLDDLQWADSASLQLMQLLMVDTDYLFIIGAYRDNEVSPGHPLMLTLIEIAKTAATIETITLAPLSQLQIGKLVADTLKCSEKLAAPLAQLVFQKTQGNPFFATQFLKALYQDGLIQFEYPSLASSLGKGGQREVQGGWQCDIARVRLQAIADDVVEFMALQLQKLPAETQEVLTLAACIGNQFDLATLGIVSERSEIETASNLWKALQEGLILPISDVYKFYQAESQQEAAPASENNHQQIAKYRFLHDRVQQAAYSLIPQFEKQATHLKIGQLLLVNIPLEEQETKIFEIVNQLNIGCKLIADRQQKEQLILLNLSAANKAKAATAYAAAVNYCMVGINLLDASSWQEQYDLTLELHATVTEVLYLNGDFQQMEQFAELTLQQAKNLLDKVKLYETQIVARIVQRKQPEALKIALSILKLLGISLPESPTESDFNLGLTEVSTNLGNRNIPDLIELPVMVEANYKAGMRILSSIISAAYVSAPDLLPLIVFKMVNLSLKFGNSPHAIMGYCMHGVILCAGLGQLEEGYKFGKLGLTLLEKINGQEFRAKVGDLFFGLTNHWQEHLDTSLPNLKQSFCTGLEIGDLEFGGYCVSKYVIYSFWLGKELGCLEQEMSTYSKALGQFKQLVPQNYINNYWQVVLNLLGKSENPCDFIGSAYDEQVMLPRYVQDNDFTGIAHLSLCKTAISYLFGDRTKAMESAEIAEKNLGGVSGTVCIPLFYFYDSLVRIAVLENASSFEVTAALEKVKTNQAKIETWAKYAPTNYWHKFYLVEAEQNRLQGQYLEAIENYDRALNLAKENQYIQEEALANELAAKFYLNWGKEKVAAGYMQQAYYCYSRWGAKAKANDLEQRYPQLLAPILFQEKTALNPDTALVFPSHSTITNTSQGTHAILDLATVMKASHAISGEMEFERLLSILMKVLLENSGAQKVALILQKEREFVVEVRATHTDCDAQGCQIDLRQSLPLESSLEVPRSLIYYTARTQKILVLDDATRSTQFASDLYLRERAPKSVLCLPIIHQGKSLGILYLENTFVAGAFSQNRVEVLNLLATQTAISLENSRLYNRLEDYSQTLEQKVEQRTQELHQKNQHLQETLAELRKTQAQLIHTEKMSSLGQMVAGIAHEINNPIGFIHSNLSHIDRYVRNLLELVVVYQKNLTHPPNEVLEKIEEIDFEFLLSDLPNLLNSMWVGSDRIRQIVLGLRNFSRLDEAQMKPVDIHEGIENTLMILQHRLIAQTSRPEIKIIKNYAKLPEISCYASQMNQVFLNLLNNAVDALESRYANQVLAKSLSQKDTANCQGLHITIATELAEDGRVLIRIADNGTGMTEEVRQRIFDPFFTTKPVGSGTGLGLSISYQIITDKHQGNLTCNSTPGQGSELAIYIPIHQ